jgi:ribonuclease BN (tRNA processing enzyme)
VLFRSPIEVGQVIRLGQRQVEVLPAHHTVPAVGFAVWPGPAREGAAWVYTGDTGPNAALWERLNQMQVGALVIETAFRDDERQLARISRHLCPTALRQELSQLLQPTEVWITHIKPGELEAVMREIAALNLGHRMQALEAGQTLALG